MLRDGRGAGLQGGGEGQAKVCKGNIAGELHLAALYRDGGTDFARDMTRRLSGIARLQIRGT